MEFDLSPCFLTNRTQIQRIPDARRSAVLVRRDSKHSAVRVKRREELEALVGTLETGTSYHILTSGDIDAGNVLDYCVQHYGPFERLYLSTWSMERQHVNTLAEHLDGGQFASFTVLTGDYFAQRSPANYTALVQLADRHGGEVYRFNNHSKLMAMRNPKTGFAISVEGSANFTRNPRVENCCITCDPALYAHHVQWFTELTEHRDAYRF